MFALLELAKQLRQAQDTSTSAPSTPSGMKPPYQKPTTKQRRGKSGGPGRKAGHVVVQIDAIDNRLPIRLA